MPNHQAKSRVFELLSVGEPSLFGPERWPDYLEQFDLTSAHVPELIAMATDPALFEAEGIETWASVHAWRALGQLRAQEAVGPLIQLMRDYTEDDWIDSDMRYVFPQIGPVSMPTLLALLEDPAAVAEAKTGVPEILEMIAKTYPDTRDHVVEGLTRVLSNYRENDEGLNGFIITSLVELKATPALPLIRDAFEADAVDEFILTWHHVLEAFGLPADAPRPNLSQLPAALLRSVENRMNQEKNQMLVERKEKEKRKAAKAARKRNRRR